MINIDLIKTFCVVINHIFKIIFLPKYFDSATRWYSSSSCYIYFWNLNCFKGEFMSQDID